MVQECLDKIKTSFSGEHLDMVLKAYEFAKKSHEGQFRQSGEPYFVHPCAVSLILLEYGFDYETVMAGLLHDVVEDTPATADELKKEFGATVLSLVEGVTKLNKIEFKSREEEQAENLRKMLFAMTDDIRVVIVKLADRLHNMRTLHFKPPERQVAISRETLEIYAPIAARLGLSNIKGELEDLAMRYLASEEYYALVEKVAAKRVERQEFVDGVVRDIENKLKELNINGDVHGRPKHFYSIYRKMLKGKSFEQIYDLIAVRIIVETVKDCYAVLGAIHTMWKPFPGRFKDYIAMPKPNKYQSLHTTVIPPSGSPFEVQIRTYDMHKVAEYGIAAHWKYKEGNTGVKQSEVDERLQWLRSMMEIQNDLQDSQEFLQSLKMDLFSDEVFVLTPKGDVVNLPNGSTGVDFAYNVHSEVGNKCVGIKIDGKIVPLNTKLTNNCIVEVITSNNSKGPSRDWLKFVVTPSARNKIRQFFKREMKEENIKRGKEMLEREARHRGYNLGDLINNQKWLKYMEQRYSLKSIDDIFAGVGYGAFTTNQVILKLIDYFTKDIETKRPVIVVSPESETNTSKNKNAKGVLIKGYDDFLTRLSHCCNPVPGDKIVGYVSRGRGVSIHRADCPNMRNVEKERIIEASWPENTGDVFTANLEIVGVDRHRLLVDLTTMLANMKLNITKVNARLEKNENAIIAIGVEIGNIEELDHITKKMYGIEGVIEVRRV